MLFDPLMPYLNAIKAAVCIALLVGAHVVGCTGANARHEKRELELEVELAQARIKPQIKETIEVTKYVDRIQKVAGPTVIRDRIVRLCPTTPEVRPAGDPAVGDTAAIADADGRPLDTLADDLATTQINKARQAYMAELLAIIYGANQ